LFSTYKIIKKSRRPFKTLWCIIVKQFEIHLRDLKAKIQCKRKTSAEKTPFVISFLCHVTDEYSILSFSFFLVIVSKVSLK
jgi:hypothetical protein